MRYIKFRAWNKRKEKMEYDFLIDAEGGIFCYNMVETLEQKNWELMQFTGLKDIKGKDIFEKDIVQWVDSDGNGRVDIVKYRPCLFYLCNNQHSVFSYSDEKMKLKIVGNIYEHPELKEK